MFHTIESDTPFEVILIDVWEPGDTSHWDEYRKILTHLDDMKRIGIGEAIGMEEITSEQVTQWDFGSFFVPFGIPK